MNSDVAETTNEDSYMHWQNRDWKENVDQLFGQDGKDQLALFVAFDICDSTRLKYDISVWREIVYTFLNSRPDEYLRLRLLKPLGDEVVFFKQVENLFSISNTIAAAYKYSINMHKMFKDRLDVDIFIKTTIWAARISKEDSAENIIVNVESYGWDFVGKDMDEGFRLAGKADKNVVIIDPKIMMAFALAKEKIDNHKADLSYLGISSGFTNSLNSFIQQGISDDESIRVRFGSSKKEFLNIMRDIIFDKEVKLKGVWGGEAKQYPVFKYYDMEVSDEIAYIRVQHRRHKRKKNPKLSNKELIEILNERFRQAGNGVNEKVKNFLELIAV